MSISRWILDLLSALLATATLPVVLELALLTPAFCFLRRRTRSRGDDCSIRLTVIVPAHNEELLIAQCIESLRASALGTGTRIVTIAHNCSDRTGDFARRAGAEVVIYDSPLETGKGFALMHGFAYAFASGADAVLVVDADSSVSENLIHFVSEALAAGVEVVQCRYELDSGQDRAKARLAALAFRGFNLIRAGGRARLGLSAGILGNGFAVRREALEQTPYNALSIVEDLEYHVQLLLAGSKVKFLEEAVVTACATTSAGGDITQRSRWEGGRAMVARRWMMPLARRMVSGRIHLLEPLLDLSSMPLGYATFVLFLGLCLPVTWLRLYFVSGVFVIGLHVLAAAWKGPNFLADLQVLARVPGYILWKLRIIPHLLRGSRLNASWVRTERELAANAVYDKPGIS